MKQTVIGIFDNIGEAQDAVTQLVSNGFTRKDIDLARQPASESAGDLKMTKEENDDSIGGFFKSLFGSDESSQYSKVARRSTVVTVHAQSSPEAQRAAAILDEYGAVDIDERASQYGYVQKTTSQETTNTQGTNAIPIIEEHMQVGKQVVETGRVRLQSRIIERPIEEHLRLREEHIEVERRSVNRLATQADLDGFKEETIEMREHAEVPVVAKEARVVEEVKLSKEVEEREEIIRDTVRNTEVEVENLDTDTRLKGEIDKEDLRNRSANL